VSPGPEPGADPDADSDLGPAFWGARYRSGDMGWDLGVPSPPFVRLDRAGIIAPCRVAVPGCGRGWEVAYLAERGYQVTGIDFSPEAIQATRERLAEAGVEAELVRGDLFDLPGDLEAAFDLVLEQTCFCAIDPVRRPEYVQAAHRLLAPGGRLIGLFYACKGEGGPPFATGPDEVRTLFKERFEIRSLAVTPHSHPRRQGEEWLGVLLKR
jgi:SAM-dependent methyltransferase